MTELVYHDLKNVEFSPFDKAVVKVASSGTIQIVSPYIGVAYFSRIIRLSTSWRLITDIEAWLSSLSAQARPDAWQFIRENISLIHHCPAIHAKAVIGEKTAFFGSANLTTAGILARTELGIFVDDLEMVTELRNWFDGLWTQTYSPTTDETDAYINWLDESARRSPIHREKFSFSTSGIKVRARLVQLAKSTSLIGDEEKLSLQKVAQELVVQEQRHFDTLKDAIESAIDILSLDSFTLSQLIENVDKAFPKSTTREIYLAALQHCANHFRTVFSENTTNRLIISDGKFFQSTKELLIESQFRFDQFLAELIDHFDFFHAKTTPEEESLEKKTGIPITEQANLIAELFYSGIFNMRDLPGKLPTYKLNEDFEWSGRYLLFNRSKQRWFMKRAQFTNEQTKLKYRKNALPIPHRPTGSDVPNLVDEEDDQSQFSVTKSTLSALLRDGKEKFEQATRARKKADEAPQTKRVADIDKILSYILGMLLIKTEVLASKQSLRDLSEKLNVSLTLVKEVTGGETNGVPKVLKIQNKVITINTSLEWETLEKYPLAQNACKSFLE